MDEKGEPDPGMRVVTLGPWGGFLGAGAGAAANLFQQGTAAVLVDERDLERARRIARRYLA